MKTLIYTRTISEFYLTADDCPISENACAWLDRWARILRPSGFRQQRGRGYGGRISGHWLKLSRAQYRLFQSLSRDAGGPTAP